MVDQQPSVGRVVHYVSFGTPGGEFRSECRAAIVTEVELGVPRSLGGERVVLAVLNPTGIFLHSLAAGGCRYDEGAEEPESPDCLNPEIHGNPMRYRDAGQCSALEGGGEGPRWEGRQGPSSALDCGTVRPGSSDNQAGARRTKRRRRACGDGKRLRSRRKTWACPGGLR